MTHATRKAGRADAEAIVELVTEAYAGDEDAAEMSLEVVMRDGFGDRPAFETLIADADGTPAGFAMYFLAYEVGMAARGLYITELFVRPRFRRRGIARALVAAVAREARRAGGAFVWWTSHLDNGPAIALYRKLSVEEDPLNAYLLYGARLDDLAAEADPD